MGWKSAGCKIKTTTRMAIKFEKTQVKGGFPVFWRGEREVLPGDFAVKGTYPEGTILKEGTPIKLDFENMECTI